MEIERITSGIHGLDKLIEGGLIKGSTNLIAGSTGTGKTIFCVQFILDGLRKGENGLYITLEERLDDIIKGTSRFSWGKEFQKYIDTKKLTISVQFPSSITELKNSIFDLLEKTEAKRFVLDSLSVATIGWKEEGHVSGKTRRDVFDFLSSLKKLGVTSLLIAEIPEGEEKKLSRFGFEEFLVDSVINLHYLEYAAGGTPRSLLIRKMRSTKHGTDIYPIEITKDGLVLKKSI